MIFPAIDILNGQSVRLYKGDYEKVTIINPDPAAQAAKWAAEGITAIHLVDLDGAKAGKPVNLDTVKAICKVFPGIVELGGGVRSRETADAYLQGGVKRVILGSAALKNPALVTELLAAYGPERVVVGVDGNDGMVATEGWLEQSTTTMADIIGIMAKAGVKYFIVTDVSRDGTMSGANTELLSGLQKQYPTVRIIASGGIRHRADIEELQQLGIIDCVVGKALFEGTLTAAEIVEVNDYAG
ncbi:MAG: 1-(5-phosphoribosyl)-5-[(5-phosphoribosylamino)methylideneamino]imidazole-4-carboxamide isomerase [Veillonella sp.]|nr:1-(5-phosphoribosyl)-5-[(5-phosphoribosylamino)methylideneamino]imidazole-4-carboxamide isomerase [Veillonella sp.]MBP9625347.1 1-(5-phosphoribosyl)-5-[(5-phosphoribosylamino)methylideneamino]imidazole-4-carboxamide isomerase [Veillonella sp.]